LLSLKRIEALEKERMEELLQCVVVNNPRYNRIQEQFRDIPDSFDASYTRSTWNSSLRG